MGKAGPKRKQPDLEKDSAAKLSMPPVLVPREAALALLSLLSRSRNPSAWRPRKQRASCAPRASAFSAVPCSSSADVAMTARRASV